MSRVAGSMLTWPRGPSPDQVLIALTNESASNLPLSFLMVWKTASTASQVLADSKSG
jgi:hypothetical protein